MDEVKRQLKDLNLVEDFDKFLQDAQGDDRETGQIAEQDDLEAEQDVKQGDQESSQDVQRSKESGQTASGGQWRADIETRLTSYYLVAWSCLHTVPGH